MRERLADLLFNPGAWFPEQGDNACVAIHHLRRIIHMKHFSEKTLLQHPHDRFLLLTLGEWLKIGFAASLTPYSLTNTMDNRLKRLALSRLSEEQIQAMDQMTVTRPVATMGRTTWDNPDALALSGIASIAQTLQWNDQVSSIHAQRFVSAEPAVEQLNPMIVEELCKILLPELPWLVSSQKA